MMRVMSSIALLFLLCAIVTFGFSSLPRHAHPCHGGVARAGTPTFLSLSNNGEDDDNVTSSSKDQSFIVEEEIAEDPFGEFAAFLSENISTQEENSSLSDGASPTATTPTTIGTNALWPGLLALASRTGRGEFATLADKQEAQSHIELLELENPSPHPTCSSLMTGKWQLVYSDTQLFRSSPFFMAGRAVCSNSDEADQYNWFCDMHRKALAISNIGAVRQVISNTTLTSEFEVKVGAVPFLGVKPPFPYSGGLPVSNAE